MIKFIKYLYYSGHYYIPFWKIGKGEVLGTIVNRDSRKIIVRPLNPLLSNWHKKYWLIPEDEIFDTEKEARKWIENWIESLPSAEDLVNVQPMTKKWDSLFSIGYEVK